MTSSAGHQNPDIRRFSMIWGENLRRTSIWSRELADISF
jgi:hypothetical protein